VLHHPVTTPLHPAKHRPQTQHNTNTHEGDPVPNLIQKLTTFARSPQATSALTKAREQVAKPENRRRLEQLRARVTRKP
jgi:hypothetical protein